MRVWSISSLSNTIPATPSNPSIPHVKRSSKLFNWVSVSIGCPENEWLARPRISGTTSITYTGDISEKISPMIIRWKKQHGWYSHYIPMIFPKFRWHSYSIFYCPWWWNLDYFRLIHDILSWYFPMNRSLVIHDFQEWSPPPATSILAVGAQEVPWAPLRWSGSNGSKIAAPAAWWIRAWRGQNVI